MKPKAVDLLAAIRNIDGLHNHFEEFGADGINPLVCAISVMAWREGDSLRTSLEHHELNVSAAIKRLVSEPGFVLSAYLGPDVLRFYVRQFFAAAFFGQTVNIPEVTQRVVTSYFRSKAIEIARARRMFKNDAKRFAIEDWEERQRWLTDCELEDGSGDYCEED